MEAIQAEQESSRLKAQCLISVNHTKNSHIYVLKFKKTLTSYYLSFTFNKDNYFYAFLQN